MFWCRHTVPLIGFVSPQNILIIVDLPVRPVKSTRTTHTEEGREGGTEQLACAVGPHVAPGISFFDSGRDQVPVEKRHS